MILLLGGTIESREFAQILEQKKLPYLISTATAYGSQLAGEIALESGRVLQGRMDTQQMKDLIGKENIRLIVDLTHPFAEVVSFNAQQVAGETGVSYLRFERNRLSLHPLVHEATDLQEAWLWASKQGEKIFLTTGSKTLPQFLQWADKTRLVVRVLPTSQVLLSCESLGLQAKQIIAMQGPFSYEMNKVQFQESGCASMITKESGARGGVDEKIQAALDLKMKVCILKRPTMDYPEEYSSLEELFHQVVHKMSC